MRTVPRMLCRTRLAWCLLAGLLLPQDAAPIEVHEDVNESPIGAHLRLNASAPPTKPVMVNERGVNDRPPPPPNEQGANNFTTFPSNHKQHSGASGTVEGAAGVLHGAPTSSPPTTEATTGELGTPTTLTVGSATVGRASAAPPPSATGPPPGLSSFRAASGHVQPGRTGTKGIVNDRSAQHQISGYRKRQLYASAVLARNSSHTGHVHEQSSDAQFAKEFVPSPEVGQFYDETSSPMLPSIPTAGQQLATSQGFVPSSAGSVDAPYPSGLSEGDSKWYAGGFGLSGHGYTTSSRSHTARPAPDESGKVDHRFSWPTPLRHHEQTVVHFRPEPTFPSPKGKWKWIPEDEDEDRKPAGSPFSSGGGSSTGAPGEPHFGKHYFAQAPLTNHPYSFDRAPGEGGGSLSGETGPATVNGTSASGEQSHSNGGGSTDVQLVGKEDAHFKSVSPWKKIIHVLSAAIPIGLLISALTPQVVYINPNATQPPIQLQTPTPISGAGPQSVGVRQRILRQEAARVLLAQQERGADPAALVKLLHKLTALEGAPDSSSSPTSEERVEGSNGLTDAASPHRRLHGCDWKLLCQLARQGMLPESGELHKALWQTANETPFEWTGQPGLEEVFRLIRNGDCSQLQRTCDQDTRDDQ